GAKTVVPVCRKLSADRRATRNDAVEHVLRDFGVALRDVTRRRGVKTSIEPLQRVAVTPLEHAIREVLLRATKAVGVDAPLLVSGAGHDAQNPSLSGVPTGMIFVRSTGGSHTPTESATVADAVLGTEALEHAIRELAG